MKQLKLTLAILAGALMLSGGLSVYADNGNLDLDTEVLSGGSDATSHGKDNIEYQVAPDLFMDNRNSAVDTNNRSQEKALQAANSVNFTTNSVNPVNKPSDAREPLFQQKKMVWQSSSSDKQTADYYGEQHFLEVAALVAGMFVLVGMTIGGIYMGLRYSDRIRNIGRQNKTEH